MVDELSPGQVAGQDSFEGKHEHGMQDAERELDQLGARYQHLEPARRTTSSRVSISGRTNWRAVS